MDAKNVMVVAAERGGTLHSSTFELLGLGRTLADQLGGQLDCLILSPKAGELAADAFQRGADRVLAAESDALADYCFQPYVRIVAEMVEKHGARAVLVPSSFRGKELAAGLAAALDWGLTTDVTAVEANGDGFAMTRAVFGGNRLANITVQEPTIVIGVRDKAFAPTPLAEGRTGEVVQEAVSVSDEEAASVRSLGLVVDDAGADVSLADAEIIVSGGRGLGKPENFDVVRQLAEVLGGAVGASRAVVDAGWIPYVHQVGQTGRTVTPKLYIACGISGAIQHLAGMRNSDVIVAINKDPEAPIFKVATYGIVGDLFEVVPKLTEKLRGRVASAT